MFLKTVSVQNFRSIASLKVEDLGQINIFTGQNNCGKTTLLEAVFQLCGWNVGSLETLYYLRNSYKGNIDFSGFFYKINDDTEIILTGFIEENSYQRTVKIDSSIVLNGFNDIQDKQVQSNLFETVEGLKIESKEIKSVATIINGVNNFSADAIAPQLYMRVNFPMFKIFEHGNLIRGLSEIIRNKQQQKIIDLLKQIDSRIVGIMVVEKGIYLDLEGFPELIPIEISGDGLRRILSVILAIYDAKKGGIVLIDEVENGLHISTMPKFWRGIMVAAHDIGVQLFMTTHNEELLQSLSEVAKEDAFEYLQPQIKYYNLKRYENDEIVAYKYDFEKFEFLISNGNEIR